MNLLLFSIVQLVDTDMLLVKAAGRLLNFVLFYRRVRHLRWGDAVESE